MSYGRLHIDTPPRVTVWLMVALGTATLRR